MTSQASFFPLLLDVWATGKVDTLDDLLPPDVTYHVPPFGDMDREGLKQFVAGFHQAIPDFSIEIDQELVDGDMSAARWTCEGTLTGESPLIPVPPTGKAFRALTGGHFARWDNGRPVEVWHNGDWLGWLQECDALPPFR
jgi:predicted ester cyclase